MSARDDYPLLATYPNMIGYVQAVKALDEIDGLRSALRDGLSAQRNAAATTIDALTAERDALRAFAVLFARWRNNEVTTGDIIVMHDDLHVTDGSA